MKKLNVHLLALTASLLCCASLQAADHMVDLGRLLYFDKTLSLRGNQACDDCHNPLGGFVDTRDNGVGAAASLGDDGVSLGDRNAPTAGYAKFSPEFHYDVKKQRYIGGQFWDGRARDLAEQAAGPPLNSVEMAMPNEAAVVERLKANAFYLFAFEDLYGAGTLDDSEQAYAAMTDAIARFEQTDFFAPFDSKYDRYLKGEYELSAQEELGMALFFSNNNTNCSTCHVLKGEDQVEETFSNYEFHNIGTPINHALRIKKGQGEEVRDQGLLANPAVDDVAQAGKFKVPTLRNIAVTGPYMHNGVFKELRTVLEFYDHYNNPARKLNPETGKPWQVAEIDATINVEDLKAKKLSDAKIDALIAFLRLLTDQRYERLLSSPSTR